MTDPERSWQALRGDDPAAAGPRDSQSIEDVLDVAWPAHDLYAATADGPVVSEDGSIVVHRTDPELAAFLDGVAALELLRGTPEGPWIDDLRRAARIIGGEQSDG